MTPQTAAQSLPLKAMHPGIAPAWWPPAPGWWWVLAGGLLLASGVAWWQWRRWRQKQRINALMRYFDDALAQAATPPEQVAVMSALLRRAARRINPAADKLAGAEWLRFLDAGMHPPVFENGPGALLLEGGFRATLDATRVAALRTQVRHRYLLWMQAT